MDAAFSADVVRRLSLDVIRLLSDLVCDAGYGEERSGVPLMVVVMASVMACMINEPNDGAAAVSSINNTLKAHGSAFRLVAVQ